LFQRARRRLILPFVLPEVLLYTGFTFIPIAATVALATICMPVIFLIVLLANRLLQREAVEY
jgi:hypothetical protein